MTTNVISYNIVIIIVIIITILTANIISNEY